MNNLRALAGSAALSMVAHVLGRGSLVLAAILLARALDTESFAAYSYFQLTVSMIAAYAALGLGVTASRFFAEFDVTSDHDNAPIGALWGLSLIGGLVFALAVLILPSALISGALSIPQWLMALGIFAIALGVVPGGGVLGLERYPEAILSAAASAFVLILGAVIAARAESPIGAMAAFVLASLVQSLANTFVVVRYVGWTKVTKGTQFGLHEMRKVAFRTAPMLGVSLLAASGSWVVGRIVLAGPGGEHAFSVYSIGLQWYALVLFVPGMVARVLLPRLVKSQLQMKNDRTKALIRTSAYLSVFAALTLSVIGGGLSPHLLAFYGSEYQADRWVLSAFLIAAVPMAPANTLGNSIIAASGQRAWFLAIFISFCCMVAAAYSFQGIGALGGAFAHGVSAVVLTITAYVIAKKKMII